MNKKVKIILNIFFFLFAFGVAFLILWMMPTSYFYGTLYEEVNDGVVTGDYAKSLSLIEKYYDKECVYSSSDGNLAVFAASSFETENETKVLKTKYSVFIRNVESDKFNSSGTNKTQIVLNDNYSLSILTTDANGDGANDSVSTLLDYHYIYFEVMKSAVTALDKIELMDAGGNEYAAYSDISLKFEESFFKDVAELEESPEDTSREEAFLNKNDNYQMGDTTAILDKANNRTMVFFIIFLVAIILFWDVVLGFHITWIPFKKLYYKMKSKKDEKALEEEPAYEGLCQLTIILDTPDGYSRPVSFRYENENPEKSFEVTLRKVNGYQYKNKITGGTYHLVKNEEDRIEELPEKLIIRSFTYQIHIKIKD